ncbi:MAG: hypothetical protein U0793_02365 [Gemmataceae bacterium]
MHISLLPRLILCAALASPGDPPPSYEAALGTVIVRPTKPDGRAWDIFGGLPDLQVIIRNLRSGDVYKSPIADDTLEHSYNVLFGKVQPGDTLEIDVWDIDLYYHDHIGLKRLDLSKEILDKGLVNLRFGQVSSLTLKFFPMRSTALKVEPSDDEAPLEDGRIATRFEQIRPSTVPVSEAQRSADKDRAIVLIHGFRAHPFDGVAAFRPYFDGWQEPHSALVTTLLPLGDIYGFSYGQNATIDKISAAPHLAEGIATLKKMGYRDIVLVGHSAGGIVARDFVEARPDCGVTSVVQVCAPNLGCCLAHLPFLTRDKQAPFLESLTPQKRMLCCARRAAKVPEHVRFVCLVGTYWRFGDGALSCDSQWPSDLQEQRIPAFAVKANHHFCMDTDCMVRKIAEVVERPYPRWRDEDVATMRRTLFGE